MLINKTKIIRLLGYVFLITTWSITLIIDAYFFDHGLTGSFYYVLFAPCAFVYIISCFLISLDSYKRLISKDQKESGSSIMFMILYNLSLAVSISMHEKDFNYIVIGDAVDLKNGIVTLHAASFFLIVSGIIGLSKRRKFTNVATVIALVVLALAIYTLAKNLS